MKSLPSASTLLDALQHALTTQWPDAKADALELLSAKGLAHDHVRLIGTGLLARIPKQSQMRLAAVENLHYQQACFDRSSAAGFAPSCARVLSPTKDIPRGALLVQEISGRNARLPQDLPLIAKSLADLHKLEMPSAEQCPPLLNEADPLLAMLEEVTAQADYLSHASLVPSVEKLILAELSAFGELCQKSKRPLKRLIAFDGHPGNFVVAHEDGFDKAYLVDLEKCRYSYPSFDLAHATLYTSTTWDVDSYAELSIDEVLLAYQTWACTVDASLAGNAIQWHLPLRKAMWLWSITWCAKWRVTSKFKASEDANGEDWSTENVDSTLASHVRERVDHYLSEAGVEKVLVEFAELENHFA